MKLIVNNNIDLIKLVVQPDSKLKLLIKPQDIIVLKINTNPNGQAINGLPSGGSTTQILWKLSNADYDTGWTDYPIEDAINNGITDKSPSENAVFDAVQNLQNQIDNKGEGSVTSVSVVNANGFNGSVATATTTPAITIQTTINGIIKGNGTAISAATANTDYTTPAYVNAKVENQIIDGVTTIAPSQNAVFDADKNLQNQIDDIVAGSVVSVTGDSPIIVDNTDPNNPVVQIQKSNTTDDGYLSSTDWNTFNNKQATLTPAALTRVDDTNVTVTLGGTPNTALLQAISMTLGWTGQLSISRGGTGQSTAILGFNALSPLTTLGDLLYHNGTNNVRLAGQITTAKQFLSQTGNGVISATPIWSTISAGDVLSGEALTKIDDTNVTLTLNGTPATALLKATSLALGWTGTLAPSRGGTGVSNTGTITLGGNLVTSGAFNLTLTQTGLTNVTLPTTGTLATLAGNETLTNKTIDADLNTITNIENADIKSGAAIAVNKLAALTANRITITDGSGFISAADTTTYPSLTELSYVKGVTSSIQTQLDSKSSSTLTNTHIYVGNAGNVATDVAMSGDVTINNLGVTSIGAGVIVNTDINATAAIAVSKLAAITANRVVVSDASGFISASSVTTTTLGYLDATSSIQTQINGKVTKGGDSGATLTIGTLTANDLEITLNNNVRWTFDNASGYLRKGSGGAYFGLQLYGTGAGSTITLGDTFDSTTPYVCVREYNGTDTDQLELYGQKGVGLRAGTFGSTTPQVWVTQAGAVCINTMTAVSGAELTVAGDVDISQTLNVQGIPTFQVSAVFNSFAKFKTATTPASPASATEYNVYYKSNKFIIQYNDAGTIRYKYLDLNGTSITWVQTTLAP